MATMARTIIFLFVLLSGVVDIKCARILAYFPTPSISHQVVFRPLTQALAKRGHEVVVVTTDPVFPKGKSIANLTEIDVHDVSYYDWEEFFKFHRGQKNDIVDEVKLIFKKFSSIVDMQMQTTAVQEVLKNKNKKYFDVLLLEACSRSLLGLAHMFDAPVILVSSFGAVSVQYSNLGAPMHPFLYPTPGRQRLYNLNIFEKALELISHVVIDVICSMTEEDDYVMMKKNFGADTPTFKELSKKIQMMFLNEHPIWADNRPIPPSIIYMGGIHQTVDKELPQDLKHYLDSSKNGVIYVSFGTNVHPSELPAERILAMKKVFSELPYNVLWKWDKDELQNKTDNIKIAKWFPQSSLLKHPNIKLFVTQGGLQSTDEAINAAVPVIGIPLSGDQWYNSEKYTHHKIGLYFDITTLEEKEFKEAILSVIKDKSYKNNILRLRSLMREYPVKPVDNAVFWTEHVIKYGGGHLQSPAANLSWIEYYELKLVLFFLAVTLPIFGIILFILTKILKILLSIYRTSLKLKAH